MSRRLLQRRFALKIPVAISALLAAAALAAPTLALAQRGPSASERRVGSSTVMGAPNAQACSRSAAVGDSSDEAIFACDRALSAERLNRANEIATLINRGALRLRRNEGELALADFEAVIAFDPRHAEAHLNRGASLVMVGRPGPAVAAITHSLTLGVREPHKAYFNRGAARESLGDLRGAYEDYSTALEIEPDWGPANAELARFARARQQRLANVLGEPQAGAP